MRTLRHMVAYSLLSVVAGALPARDVEVAPQVGGRFGGELTDEATNRDVSLDSDTTFGLGVDVALAGEGRYLRLFWSRERTEAELPDPALPPQKLTLDNLHFGGAYRWTQRTVHPYVAAAVGLTVIDAGDAEVFPSRSLAVGVRRRIGARLALWLEGCGIATIETGEAQIVCGGGCVLALSGGGFFQTEIQTGLSIRF